MMKILRMMKKKWNRYSIAFRWYGAYDYLTIAISVFNMILILYYTFFSAM